MYSSHHKFDHIIRKHLQYSECLTEYFGDVVSFLCVFQPPPPPEPCFSHQYYTVVTHRTIRRSKKTVVFLACEHDCMYVYVIIHFFTHFCYQGYNNEFK